MRSKLWQLLFIALLVSNNYYLANAANIKSSLCEVVVPTSSLNYSTLVKAKERFGKYVSWNETEGILRISAPEDILKEIYSSFTEGLSQQISIAYSIILTDTLDSSELDYIYKETSYSSENHPTLISAVNNNFSVTLDTKMSHVVEYMTAISIPFEQVRFVRTSQLYESEEDLTDNLELEATPTFINEVDGIVECNIRLNWTASSTGAINQVVSLHCLEPKVIAIMRTNGSNRNTSSQGGSSTNSGDVAIALVVALIRDGVIPLYEVDTKSLF